MRYAPPPLFGSGAGAEGRVASAHHICVELVAFGITEIGRVKSAATARAGRAFAGAAERQRELVDAIDLGFVFRQECGHDAVSERHRLAIERKRKKETSGAPPPSPPDQTGVFPGR